MPATFSGADGVRISWPVLAMTGALLLSLVTGAIQLGGVQTHVIINTGRLEKIEASHAELERQTTRADASQVAIIAAIKARQDANDVRIDELMRISRERLLVLEQTRPTAAELQAIVKSTSDQITRILDRIDRLENRK